MAVFYGVWVSSGSRSLRLLSVRAGVLGPRGAICALVSFEGVVARVVFASDLRCRARYFVCD